MAEGFRVDLDALERAAEGVSGTLAQVRRHKISDIDCAKSAFGHDHLADTVADFCARWQLGVDNLAKDGREVTGRLTESAVAYQKVEAAAKDHFGGIVQSPTGPDPAGG